MVFDLCNIKFEVLGIIPDFLADFKCNDTYNDVIMTICNYKNIDIEGTHIYYEEGLLWTQNNRGYGVYVCGYESKEPVACLLADKNWKNIILAKKEQESSGVFKTMFEIVLRTVILFYNGIVLHASGIKYKDVGLVFSASSGGGKSTHTNLWEKYLNSEILNGDRPVLRLYKDEYLVYGSPFCGTSGKSNNLSAVLHSVVFLDKSLENSFYKISVEESMTRLISRSFLPYFSKPLIEKAVDNLSGILFKVPMYVLKCNKEISSAKKVLSCLDI